MTLYLSGIGTYMYCYLGKLVDNERNYITIFDTSEYDYLTDGFSGPSFSLVK